MHAVIPQLSAIFGLVKILEDCEGDGKKGELAGCVYWGTLYGAPSTNSNLDILHLSIIIIWAVLLGNACRFWELMYLKDIHNYVLFKHKT